MSNNNDNGKTDIENEEKSIPGIDFPIPRIIKNTIEDTEKSLEEYGELGPYIDWVDTLDNVCKECYVTNAITKEQWKIIMSRFKI